MAILYTPTANFRGTDSFTYTLSDGQGGTATATVRVAVLNRPPVAQDDTATTPAGTTVTIALLANDRDPDGDALTVASLTPPTQGTATVQAPGMVLYTPQTGFRGADSFTYTLSDG